MFAVIQTGGKEYLVTEGQILKVEKLSGTVGENIALPKVLLLFDEKGERVDIGKPTLSSAKVEAKILLQARARKVSGVKYKPKVRYRRAIGHRQPYTKLEILSIS